MWLWPIFSGSRSQLQRNKKYYLTMLIKLYYIISYHIILYHIILYYIIYHKILYYLILFHIILDYILLYYMMYHKILYYLILFHIILDYIILYYIYMSQIIHKDSSEAIWNWPHAQAAIVHARENTQKHETGEVRSNQQAAGGSRRSNGILAG